MAPLAKKTPYRRSRHPPGPPARVVSVVEEQARALANPVTTVDELLERLRAIGLPRSIAAIRHQFRRMGARAGQKMESAGLDVHQYWI